jgi:peptide chain release factor subunit 1
MTTQKKANGTAEHASSTILILTPVKDAVRHLEGYVARVESLACPRANLSIGILESDSRDDTWALLQRLRPRLDQRCRKVTTVKRDFGFRLPKGVARWAPAYQLTRRTILARARNQLLFRALDDEDWVLWLDVDVIDYPCDLIDRLLAVGLDIVHPHCVLSPAGPTFDLNGWSDHGRKSLNDFRGSGRPVRLDAVGGTALLVRADVHRDGLIFPPFRYGVENKAIRPAHDVWGKGEVETEGLGILAQDMGHQCWGLPDLEVIHAPD